MHGLSLMAVAGEPSGDRLAAELISALRPVVESRGLELCAYGAGGPEMSEAGCELVIDMTEHSVVGLWEVAKRYLDYRRLFHQLLDLAVERRPDVVLLVDFSGFNRRFAEAVRHRALTRRDWRPKLVYFVSPQVWASRPGRARTLERDLDLLLSIFPFEKNWYARRAPGLRVEYVGHPMLDRYPDAADGESLRGDPPYSVVLLPGSRRAEIERHLPIIGEACVRLAEDQPVQCRVIVPNERLSEMASGILRSAVGGDIDFPVQVGGLAEALRQADLAFASTGTVTMECAVFRVPTITLYRTSWLTYVVGKQLVTVSSLTMPNLMAGEEVFPEFIQEAATPEALVEAARRLMADPEERSRVQSKLDALIGTLGRGGACRRAARLIVDLVGGGHVGMT